MKNYITLIIIGMFFLSACKNTEFVADTGNDDPVTIPQDPVDDTNTTDVNDSDINTTIDNNVTEELIRKEITSEINAKEWYIRLIVEDVTNDLKSTSTQLGQIETNNAIQDYTLKAIAPFSAPYLDVVFVDPNGVDAGSYKSSFHISSTDADMWTFTIKSSDTNADMILSWRGLYVLNHYVDNEDRTRYHEYRTLSNPLLKYMTLVDVSTNTEIDVLESGTVNAYTFNMDGATERVFQWKIKDSSISILPKITTFNKIVETNIEKQNMKALQIEALRKDAKAMPEKLRQQRLNTVDTRRPPSFEVLE